MKNHLLTALACTALLAAQASAQGTERLLTTVGTTVENGGTTHAYLLWQPGDSAATLGKRFAIYRKSGAGENPAPFTRLGIQTLQTSPNTVRAMLELGAKVDRAAAAAPARIDGLYRELTFNAAAAPATPQDPTLDAAGKLVFLLQSAVTDPRALSRLFFLGRAHPGVMMVLGHAFAIPVSPGVHTFEIREIDIDDIDFRVLGRISLDTENPIILEAPAPPFQVFHPVSPDSQYPINAKDHLNARLRWGMDATLRSQLPHTFGFDLFRVKKDLAESLGWNAEPPAPADMLAALASANPADPNPDVSQINELPILTGDLLTPAEAADPSDVERFDISDDGIWHTGGDGKKIRRPFTDGEAYYCFVAARGITGMPGQLSNGTLVTMCDRHPPRPPAIFSVQSNFVRPDDPADWEAQGGSQFLQVKIQQLPSGSAADAAAGYYIYRWSTAEQVIEDIGNPETGRIGYLPHLEGAAFQTFDDNQAGAPTLESHGNQSIWYTVRAVGRSACAGEVLSGHSAPLPGFLRDFKAPDGPTGDFLICRQLPIATLNPGDNPAPENPVDSGQSADYTGIGIRVERTSDLIVAAEIEVTLRQPDNTQLTVHSKRYSYQNGNFLHIHLPYRIPPNEETVMTVRVRGVTTTGLRSGYAVKSHHDSSPLAPPYSVFRFTLTTEQHCQAISEATENPPIHEAFAPDGTVNPITGSISFPDDQGVREWRVYRRAGRDGPLSLIAKAEGDTLQSPATWQNDALPVANGTRVCYYVQLFDQNANPSPLIPIGCTVLLNPDLPTPMLAPATITGENEDRMTVRLEWFCDPAGVERFEILIARDDGTMPQVVGISPPPPGVQPKSVSDEFPDLDFFPHRTLRVGTNTLGDGPGFALNLEIEADSRAYFAVRACGEVSPETNSHGDASNVVAVRWQAPPEGQQPVIPWPAREISFLYDQYLPIPAYAKGEGPLWPLVLPSELGLNTPTGIMVGLTRHPVENHSPVPATWHFSPASPESYLFQYRDKLQNVALGPLMPIMLYRYQVDSDAFPDARANLVQCTPLIDRMAWKHIEDPGSPYYELRDPFFLVLPFSSNLPIPVGGTWTKTKLPEVGNPNDVTLRPPYLEDATGMILLRDPLPVTTGAAYRHIVVRFDSDGEIKQVIPLAPVQH